MLPLVLSSDSHVFEPPDLAGVHRTRVSGLRTKTTGDGMLVGFASVVDAVRCAVAAQQAKPHELSCCLPISSNE
jgi:hypothetical protein